MNSRRKGATNERNIAKALELWTKKKFAKTPASGGLQWKSSMSRGDVVCTTEGHYFPFCIEGKFYKEINFNHLFTPGLLNVDILDWWKQCRKDAEKCNKVPWLWMRYNGLPRDFWFMILPAEFYGVLPSTGRLRIRRFWTFQNKDLKRIHNNHLLLQDRHNRASSFHIFSPYL